MTPSHDPSSGSLLVVGTGITGVGQVTLEAVEAIESADQLFYIANNPFTEAWLKHRNPSAQTLSDLYSEGKDRSVSYVQMAARVVRAVRKGLHVCVALYGHPGVFVQFSHVAIRLLRREGFSARMLPGISADGCMIADVGFNPGDHGIQSFEASNFLMYRRRFDPTSTLVLWQVGVIGEADVSVARRRQPERLTTLAKVLCRYYPKRHRVIVYCSATFPGNPPSIKRIFLERLPAAKLSPIATLLVPPLRQRRADARVRRWFEVGITRQSVGKADERT